MAETLGTVTLMVIVGGVPTPVQFYSMSDGTASVLCSQPFVNGAPGGVSANPLFVTDSTVAAAAGTTADAAWSGTGSSTIIAALKAIWTALTSAIPAGANLIGKVFSSDPPITGFGTLTLSAAASTAASTLTLGTNSAAWPATPGKVTVYNSGANPCTLCPLGGAANANNGLTIPAYGFWSVSGPASGMTLYSALGTTVEITF
jgi:hypothetical protein